MKRLPTACPKPARTGPKPKKPILRSEWLARNTKPLKKKNLVRIKRKLAAYAAFMASPEWKAIRQGALKRADYRCEELIQSHRPGAPSMTRCTETTRLTVHHKTYARFGGRELPRDLQVLCKPHHDAVEALKGTQRLWQQVKSA